MTLESCEWLGDKKKYSPPHVILDCTLQRKFQGYKYVKVMGKCDITYLDKHLMKILNILN